MNCIKQIILFSCTLFTFTGYSQIIDSSGCGEYKIGDKEYELVNHFVGELEDSDEFKLSAANSLFHHQGNIYIFNSADRELWTFSIPSSGNSPAIEKVNFELGKEVTGEIGGFRFYFFGETPGGEVYAASFIHSKPGTTTNKPFEIFLLNFDKGATTAVIEKCWELPVGNDCEWGPRYPRITGNMKGGDFDVAAQVWLHSNYKAVGLTDYNTRIAYWNVTEDKVNDPLWATADISGAMVCPLGENKVLVHDKQLWRANPNFNSKFNFAPIVGEISKTHQLKELSVLNSQCTQYDKYGCGAVTFSNGVDSFIAYHTGLGGEKESSSSNKIGLAYLPSGVADLSSAKQITTVLNLENSSEDTLPDDQITHVQASKIDDKTTLLYSWLPSHQILGVYTLTRKGDDSPTGSTINLVNKDEQVQYYNIQGLSIPYPTSPGVYLRRSGDKVEKIIISKR